MIINDNQKVGRYQCVHIGKLTCEMGYSFHNKLGFRYRYSHKRNHFVSASKSPHLIIMVIQYIIKNDRQIYHHQVNQPWVENIH